MMHCGGYTCIESSECTDTDNSMTLRDLLMTCQKPHYVVNAMQLLLQTVGLAKPACISVARPVSLEGRPLVDSWQSELVLKILYICWYQCATGIQVNLANSLLQAW